MRFFDTYPRFYETTATRRLPNRLAQRWEMMIERNGDVFRGARVLDLASHDGRWSFAALKAGAAYVEGVEARPDLVRHAAENFAHYQVEREQFSFECNDVVTYLNQTKGVRRFDVVLNLGFFYHTLKHLEILEGCAALGVKTMIIDTGLSVSADPVIELSWDQVADPRHAIDHLGAGRETAPVGRVSRAALAMMLDYAGFDCTEMPWSECSDFSECMEYKAGSRSTFVARALNREES